MVNSRKKRKYYFGHNHVFLGNQFCYRTKYKRGVHLNKKHKAYGPQTVKRLNKVDFSRITRSSQDGRSYRVTGTEGPYIDNNVMLLRPKYVSRTAKCDKYLKLDEADTATSSDHHDEMRLLSPNKVTAMWNKCIKEHENEKSVSCKDIALFVHKEIKKGLCWEQSLACKNCSYKSKTYKLYAEVKSRTR